MASGEIYFRRAVRIAEESPDTNWQVVGQAVLALGDYYMYNSNPQRGRQVYTEAWEMLSETEEARAVRREQLESVLVLRQDRLPQYVSTEAAGTSDDGSDPVLQGSVSMGFDVTTGGRADDIRLIDAQPAEFESMIDAVERELRRRIYRPRIEDGEVVATPDQVLNHRFYYRQSDLAAARAGASEQ